jgi:hypothetical protein
MLLNDFELGGTVASDECEDDGDPVGAAGEDKTPYSAWTSWLTVVR